MTPLSPRNSLPACRRFPVTWASSPAISATTMSSPCNLRRCGRSSPDFALREIGRVLFFSRRQQRGIAAGGGGIDRNHLLVGKAPQIIRAAGLGSRSGEPGTAKRLSADHGADRVAVNVDIAIGEPFDNALNRGIDARVNAQSKTVAACRNIIEQGVELVGAPANHVQNRSEH